MSFYELRKAIDRMEQVENVAIISAASTLEDGRILMVRIKPFHWDEVLLSDENGFMQVVGAADAGVPKEIFEQTKELRRKLKGLL